MKCVRNGEEKVDVDLGALSVNRVRATPCKVLEFNFRFQERLKSP